MADPLASAHANTVSQEEEEVLGRVYTVPFDAGGMEVGDLDLDNSTRVLITPISMRICATYKK